MAFASLAFLPAGPVPHRTPRRLRAKSVCRAVRARAAEPPAAALSAHTDVLLRAAEAYVGGGARPPAQAVAEALVGAERESKRQRLMTDGALLHGQWQLVFTSDPRSRFPPLRAIYFPVDARQTFSAAGRFDNCVYLPGGNFAFEGPFRWVQDRNRMEFTFSQFRIQLGPFKWKLDDIDKHGSTLEGRTVKELPFFVFFLVGEDIAVNRGRTGGFALYAKLKEQDD